MVLLLNFIVMAIFRTFSGGMLSGFIIPDSVNPLPDYPTPRGGFPISPVAPLMRLTPALASRLTIPDYPATSSARGLPHFERPHSIM